MQKNIDRIWHDLEQEFQRPPKTILNYLCSNQPCTNRKVNISSSRPQECDTGSNLKLLDALSSVIEEPISIALSKGEVSPREMSQSSSVIQLANTIILWAKDNRSKVALVTSNDSDDDSDEESKDPSDITSVSSSISTDRLYKVVRRLRSSSMQDRVDALKSLEVSIQKLSECVETMVKPLDFSPPYHISNTTLTHRDNLVSDLETTKWLHWDKTYRKLSSQFAVNVKEKTIEVNQNEALSLTTHGNRESLQSILNVFLPVLCETFGDKFESCRSLAMECASLLCSLGVDIGKHISCLITTLASRYKTILYDENLQIFVYDAADNDFYRRGGATHRQDRSRLLSGNSLLHCWEPCEEVRFGLCKLFSSVIECCFSRDSLELLDPYFADILFAVQSNLSDPFHEIKVFASKLLVQMVRIPQWESGAMHFAVALARSAIPNLRHRNTRVRLASIDLFEATVAIPDRNKLKGAGSETILDLLGYREENVLPVAAFYESEYAVSINILAELSADKNRVVRMRLCRMICLFLTCLPDRFDFFQRLLPYVLGFHTDECTEITSIAMDTIVLCGQQYEAEHSDEMIERLQYGVDGDDNCNHHDPLPAPFIQRPSLGVRLFVRNNSKRIIEVVISEIKCCSEKTREAAAKLLKVLIVYNEEYLTIHFHNILSSVTNVIQASLREQQDMEKNSFLSTLNFNMELLGRFIEPTVYVQLLLPRVMGEVESGTSFCDGGFHPESSRLANTMVLNQMIKGSMPSRIIPHKLLLLQNLLSESMIGPFVGSRIKLQSLSVVATLLDRVQVCIPTASGQYSQSEGTSIADHDIVEKCLDRIDSFLNENSERYKPFLTLARGLMAKLSNDPDLQSIVAARILRQ